MAWKIVYIISPFVNSIVRAIRLTRFKFIHLYLILSWDDFIIHYEVYAEIYSFFFLHYIPPKRISMTDSIFHPRSTYS